MQLRLGKIQSYFICTGTTYGSKTIKGHFSNSIQENKVKNLADEIQQMEQSDKWNNPDTIVEHLSHIENFLIQTEILYKNAQADKYNSGRNYFKYFTKQST